MSFYTAYGTEYNDGDNTENLQQMKLTKLATALPF
jgi:hypothetical protein